MVAAAAVVGGGVTLLFGYWAWYFIAIEPRSVLTGLLWLAVAVSVPTAALTAGCLGVRKGAQREALLVQVSVTTIIAAQCSLALTFWLRVVGAYLTG